jgi:hypothetical protein
MDVIITKIGLTNFKVTEGKSNLQLRELEFMQNALSPASTGSVSIMSIPEILSNTSPCNIAILVFQGIHANMHELYSLLDWFAEAKQSKLILVSNDIRLPFDLSGLTDIFYSKLVARKSTMQMITNAQYNLQEYRTLATNSIVYMPIKYVPLYTLPAFTTKPTSIIMDKPYKHVYAAMYARDYDDKRMQELLSLHKMLGDDITLLGNFDGTDMSELTNVHDCVDMPNFMSKAMFTPVLLEEAYDKYKVMPNRISEAIMCSCIPIVVSKTGLCYSPAISADDIEGYICKTSSLLLTDRAFIVSTQTAMLYKDMQILSASITGIVNYKLVNHVIK